MKYVKINNKSYEIPTRWRDITFLQYVLYMDIKDNDLYSIVEIFTGIKKQTWEKSKEVRGFYLITNALEFLTTKPSLYQSCPDYIEYKGNRLDIPKALDEHTVKQYEDMRAIIQIESKKGDVDFRIYPKIISIYLCEKIQGEYSPKTWEATIPIIEKMSFYDVMGMGSFFLRNLIELRNGTNRDARPLNMIRKKLMRVSRILKYGVF